MTTTTTPLDGQRKALEQHLCRHFGAIAQETLDAIHAQVEWVTLEAGEVLMAQGDPGDSAYLSLSGRLRVYVTDEQGQTQAVRELGRGEITGEISLYSGDPRSATVVAIRRTLLARLDKEHFTALVARNPQVSFALTNNIIHRLQTQHHKPAQAAPVLVTLLPVQATVDARALAEQLTQALQAHGKVCWTDAQRLLDGPSANPEQQLDELEAQHDFVLLVADATDTPWSRLCLSHSDEILLLADATLPPTLHPLEQSDQTAQRSEAAETLVLLHPADTQSPRGMRRWLDRRPVTGHVNLRPALERDMARLARLLSRQAVGLVLAGGGARGFAHLGIWKTLRERGIEIDCVGGTSMGAVMAALIAADQDIDRTLALTRQAFKVNPTGDYNLLPLVSLIKGGRVRQIIERSLNALTGGPVDMVDLWKGYFCVASNYSQGNEVRLYRGDLARSLRASIAIPGALPPVTLDGDLLCDGGTFNNFPANVMRDMRGVGKVIGVDLSARSTRRFDFDEIPGTFTLLLDRLKPRAQRRYRLPSLMAYLLNVTILYSVSRQNESMRQTDLYLNPPLARVGLLQWKRFASIVKQGEEHAQAVLDGLSPEQKRHWGLH